MSGDDRTINSRTLLGGGGDTDVDNAMSKYDCVYFFSEILLGPS